MPERSSSAASDFIVKNARPSSSNGCICNNDALFLDAKSAAHNKYSQFFLVRVYINPNFIPEFLTKLILDNKLSKADSEPRISLCISGGPSILNSYVIDCLITIVN